jgi:hypothetical protein
VHTKKTNTAFLVHSIMIILKINYKFKPKKKYLLYSSACEKHNPLQLLIVKEVIERPQTSWLSIGIRAQIRIVTVNVTIRQTDFIFNG